MVAHLALPDDMDPAVLEEMQKAAKDFAKSQDDATKELQGRYVFMRLLRAESPGGGHSVIRRAEVNHLKEQVQQAHSRADALEEKHNTMKRELVTAQAESARLQKVVDRCLGEIKETKPALVSLQFNEGIATDQFKFKIDFYESKLQILADKNASLQSRVDALSSGLESGEDESGLKVNDVLAELQTSIMETEAMYSCCEVQEKKAEHAEKALEVAKAQAQKATAECEASQVQIQQSAEIIEELKARCEASEGNMKHCKHEARCYRSSVEGHRQEIRRLNNQIALLRGELILRLAQTTETEKKGLEFFSALNPDLVQEASASSKVVSDFCSFAVAHRRKLDAELAEAEKQVSDMEDQMKEAQGSCSDLADTVEKMKIELAQAIHSRNQFLILSRSLQLDLEKTKQELASQTQQLMQDMRFFSEQYESLKLVEPSSEDLVTDAEPLDALKSGAEELQSAKRAEAWTGVHADIMNALRMYDLSGEAS